MTVVQTSILAGYGTVPGDDGPLGLLAWVPEEAAFFPVVGREDFVRDLAITVRDAEDQASLIEYLLERGPGARRSFSAPETVEADSLRDAARRVAVTRRIAFAVPGRERPRCSSCGDVDDLHVVTLPYGQGNRAGRLLVYCRECRRERQKHFGIDVPLADVTITAFVGLYADGFTESDPETAAGIVFGEAPIDAVRKATAAMAASGLAG